MTHFSNLRVHVLELFIKEVKEIKKEKGERIQLDIKKIKKSLLRGDVVVTWLDFSMIPKAIVQY